MKPTSDERNNATCIEEINEELEMNTNTENNSVKPIFAEELYASGYKEKSTMSKENQYIERGIYKVRQDGTKDFVPFMTREEKLADKKEKELIIQQVKTFQKAMENSGIYFVMSTNGKDFYEFGGGF